MDTQRIVKTPPDLDRTWVSSCDLLGGVKRGGHLTLDLSATTRIDSAGVCLLELLGKMYREQGGELTVVGASAGVKSQFIDEMRSATRAAGAGAPAKENIVLRAGGAAAAYAGTGMGALSVFAEMLYWSTIGLFKRQDMKKGGVYEQMYQLGYKAVGIIVLLSFLIGVVLSLQSAIQLKSLGMGIFLVPLIGATMIRQMGPLLTAIILAGRTGSATTAEIATMVVGEEIDALRTMGINPMQYIMAPKFWAISLTMPLLSILATAAGILGGYVIAIFYLDFNTPMFLRELAKVIKLRHVLNGCFKSMVFSWLIIWVGCYFGFRVRGGAEAVGRETTSSVVVGIFVIIVANALFSFVM